MGWKINRNTLLFPCWYFFSIGAMSITSFLSLYLKQLGLSPWRIGTATCFKYIGVCLITPIIGLLVSSSQYKNIIIVLVGMLWISGGFTVGFLIPEYTLLSCNDMNRRSEQVHGCKLNIVTSTPSELIFLPTNVAPEHNQFSMCSLIKSTMASDRSWMFQEDNMWITFMYILIGNSLIEIMIQPLQSITDAECVNTLEDYGLGVEDYGSYRAVGSLAWGIMPLIFGAIINKTRHTESICGVDVTVANYNAMFGMFLFAAAITVVLMFWFPSSYHTKNNSIEAEQKDNLTDMIKLLGNIPNLTMVFVVLFVGMCDGMAIGFVFWHLDNIGGNELIMGLSCVCHCVSEVTIGVNAGAIIRRFGYFPVIVFSFVIYAFRFTYYAYITRPWLILGSEILHGFTFILIWSTAVSYLSQTVPKRGRNLLMSLLNTLFNGLGKMIAYLLSGYFIQNFGSRAAFKLYALMCFIIAMAVVIIASIDRYSQCEHDKQENKSISYTSQPRPDMQETYCQLNQR